MVEKFSAADPPEPFLLYVFLGCRYEVKRGCSNFEEHGDGASISLI